jgi:hypothetical protein
VANKNLKGIGETDQRILQKRILAGKISGESLQPYFDSLPDVSHNVQEVRIPWKTRNRPVAAGGSGDAD